MRPLLLLTLACALGAAGCSPAASPPAAPVAVPAARPIDDDSSATMQSIRFLEEKAKSDPEDFVARNKLVGYYLQRLRETGNHEFLALAERAARESLATLPAEQNVGGLAALAQVELASHDFAAAREHARQLTEVEPGKLYPRLLLADAQIETGDYEGAAATLGEVERRADGDAAVTIDVETRLARLDLLRGDHASASRRFATALESALAIAPAPRETVAWLYWQLGETAFAAGRYDEAERRYRESLTTFDNYYRALASLGRVLAARDDLAGAIAQYEAAVRLLPDPEFVGALGDLYALAGREADARAQYDLVRNIARLDAGDGSLYSRQIALFLADHDLEPERAYASAVEEYETRRDVYGADAVAWTALKAGKTAEAAAASKEALRLGTKDAEMLYHAGMIALAAGDTATGRDYLERALALNPRFDPLQSRHAREALARVGGQAP